MSSLSIPRLRSSLPRVALVLVVAAVTLAGLVIAAAEPAHGQAAPSFPCDGGLYVVTGSPTNMALNRVDQNTGSLTAIGGGGLTANALAYNPADDYLYGMNRNAPHDVVRVHADGTQTSLGPATGAPTDWELTAVGTFLENGRYLVLGDPVPPSTPAGTVPALWAEIDVSTSPPSVVRTFSHPSVANNDLWDVAVSPLDGELYAFSISADRIVRIDAATGAATPVGPQLPQVALTGSSFFDSFGRLWLYGDTTGTNVQDTLFRIDDIFDDTAQIVGSGPAVTNSDGASCPFSVGMEKTADPATVCAGGTTTFRLTMSNESPNGAAITADFLDRLDGERTFVAGSLVNPFGGQVNDYGGGAELAITDLSLPGGTADAITVDVAVPANHPPATFTNQAALMDLSGNVGPAVLSEYPGTPQLPDPTPVTVASCVDLGVTKTTDAPVIGVGDEITYAIRIINNGPSDAVAIDSLLDALPAGTSLVAATDGGALNGFGTISWPAFDLAAGAHRDFTVTVQGQSNILDHADDRDQIVNVVTVSHPGDDNPDNDSDRAVVPVPRPDLAITKDDGVDVIAAGDETTYDLVATNHGEGHAIGAVLTDTLPEGTELVSASSGGTAQDGVVTWSGIDLDAGESQTMTVTVRVSPDMAAGETITNTAVIAHDDDADPTDNQDDDTDTVIDPDPPTITRRPARPPSSPPSRPAGFLPRTGAELMNWTWVALALLGLGGAAWVNDRTRNP
jgi:uncharacterized repeat protein (TIGR01451 family)